MRRATNGQKLAPLTSVPSPLPVARKLIRVGRPANDNLPLWTVRASRAIIIGGAALAILIIVALVYA